MKILLTGSQGFTGIHFARMAQLQGHTILPLRSDLLDTESLSREIEGLDFTHVVHLGAISFVGHTDDRAFYEVNLFGTLNLLKALLCVPKPPTAVLLASSANVYGNRPVSPITEASSLSPVNHYATSKLAMEHMARTYEDRLPLLFVRPFNYTGPGQSPSFLIPKLVHHFKSQNPLIELGNMDVEREFNDVRMVTEAYLKLLEKGEMGSIYNVCSGQPHALRGVIDQLVEMTGHHPKCHVNEAFVRPNEVIRLCGNPGRLKADIGDLHHYTLKDTLAWMLSEDGSQGASG